MSFTRIRSSNTKNNTLGITIPKITVEKFGWERNGLLWIDWSAIKAEHDRITKLTLTPVPTEYGYGGENYGRTKESTRHQERTSEDVPRGRSERENLGERIQDGGQGSSEAPERRHREDVQGPEDRGMEEHEQLQAERPPEGRSSSAASLPVPRYEGRLKRRLVTRRA